VGTSRQEPESGALRKRYDQLRERALEGTVISSGSEVLVRRGMRSWMEAGGWEEMPAMAPAFHEGRTQTDPAFRQIVIVWASALVGQAERSYGGQREV
jgi:hypothetical protein